MRINEIANRGFFYNQEDAINALIAGELVQYVKGDLNLHSVKNISIRGNLIVTGTLSIYNADSLPDKLRVGSLSILGGSHKLPDTLVIQNSLSIDERTYISLPNDLVVPGNLSIVGTRLREFPSTVKVGGNITLRRCGLNELPNNLVVNGDLDIEANSIEHLPNDLVVGGDLNLLNTWIDDIPKTIRVGGTITGKQGGTINQERL